MFTNYKTIGEKIIHRLKDPELMEEDGTFQRLPKKEAIKAEEKSKDWKNSVGAELKKWISFLMCYLLLTLKTKKSL